MNSISVMTSNIFKILTEKNKTLSIAESCTGGLIASSITDVPGSSKIFLGGVIVYATAMKKKILKIPEKVFNYGVISEQMAEAMALSVKSLTGSDYSIATTGNLGPDTMENKPAGLIYIAVATPENVFVKELRLEGDRYFNKKNATKEALEFLIEKIF